MSRALAVYHGSFGRATLYNLDRPMATHAHREGHLVFRVHGRSSSMTVGGRACPISDEAAVAANPWQPHSFHPGDEEHGTLFLVLYVRPVWFLGVSRSARSALRFGRNRIEVTPQLRRLVQLVAALLLEDAHGPLFAGYLCELTQECFDQSWQWTPEATSSPGTWPGGARDRRVRTSLRLMRERIGEEVLLSRIARDAGLSRPHFYKLFRQQMGLTPNLYLNTLRMETAIERLTTTVEAVTSIGLDLGFASQASFSRFFTSNVGIAPTDYRRMADLAVAG